MASNHTKALVPNLREQISSFKELVEEAGIYWEILNAKRNVPPNKPACQGMPLILLPVQSPERVHAGRSLAANWTGQNNLGPWQISSTPGDSSHDNITKLQWIFCRGEQRMLI